MVRAFSFSIFFNILCVFLSFSIVQADVYEVSLTSTSTDWAPTGWPTGSLTASDTVTISSSVANAAINVSETVNIAGTFNFAYTDSGANTTFNIATAAEYASHTLNLVGAVDWNVGKDAQATIYTKLTSDTGSTAQSPYTFTKSGEGTLTICLNNNAQGNSMVASIVVAEGTLKLLASSTSGINTLLGDPANSILVKSNATLILQGSRLMGDGYGSVTLEDNATITVNGGNNELGKSKVLTMGANSVINGTGTFNFRSNETIKLDVDGAASATISANMNLYDTNGKILVGANDTLTISGAFYPNHVPTTQTGIVKQGEGTLVLSNANSTFTGPINIQSGVVEITSKTTGTAENSALGVGTAYFYNNKSGTSDASGSGTPAAISVAAGAELKLSADRAAGYSMRPIVLAAQTGEQNGGKVTINGAEANLGMGVNVTLNDGAAITGTGTWNFKSTDPKTVSYNKYNSTTDKFDGETVTVQHFTTPGSLTLAGANASAAIDVANIAFQGTENYISVSDSTSMLTIASVISGGTTNLTVGGAGTTVFNNAANDFNNQLTVQGGAVVDLQTAHFFAGEKTANSILNVEANSTAKVAAVSALNLQAVRLAGGTLDQTAAGIACATSSVPLTFTGAGATFLMSGADSSMTIGSTIAPGGALTLGGVGNYIVTEIGQIADFPAAGETPAVATNLIKTGTGSLTLNSAQIYSGSTILAGGTTTLGVANALPTGTALTVGSTSGDGAILDLKGQSAVVSNLSGYGEIVNSGASLVSLTVNIAANETTTWNGDYVAVGSSGTGTGIGGSISLTVQGGGTFYANGINTFTGDLYIGDNTTFVANVSAPGSLSASGSASNIIHVGKNATLKYAQNRSQGSGASIDIDEGGTLLIDNGDLSLAWGANKYISLKNGSRIAHTAGAANGQIQWRSGSTIKLVGENATATVSGFSLTLRDGEQKFDVQEASSVLYVSALMSVGDSGQLKKIGAGTLVLENSTFSENEKTFSTTISDGTVQLGNNSATGILVGPVTLAASSESTSATLAFARSDAAGFAFGNAITANSGSTILNQGAADVTVSALTLSANSTVNATRAGQGDLIITQPTLNAGSTLNLTNNQTDGALTVSGATGAGNIKASASTAVVNLVDSVISGNVTSTPNAIVSFSNVQADSMDFNGNWQIDLANPNAGPLITLTGTGAFGADAKITLSSRYSRDSVNLLSANLVTLADVLILQDGQILGLLSNIKDETTGLSDEYAWNILPVYTNGTLTGLRLEQDTAAIPEPSTWLLLILSFLGLGVLTRKRFGPTHN